MINLDLFQEKFNVQIIKGSLLVLKPRKENTHILQWIEDHKKELNNALLHFGGVLFRNCNIDSIETFNNFICIFSENLEEYTNASTPRNKVSGNIYTSTDYPADQKIPHHSEMSYTSTWPMKIWFYCMTPSKEGGETPIADNREILKHIDSTIKMNFKEKGVKYVRNFYEDGMGINWEKAFNTNDKSKIEKFCRDKGIKFNWFEGGLTTEEKGPGIYTHPITREEIWFNQAHLFHISDFDLTTQEFLLEQYTEKGLPRNSYYGDGMKFDAAVLSHIQNAYAKCEISFPWEKGDVLMLDNMLMSHSRNPFKGERKVVVGMADMYTTKR
ncbi:TauD/TfdA family dioxygenase [Bacillus sp. SRB3LM]|uniref:TauD/TfdA family dioxygenase n=1 Tax=Bacillus sp. SRB3LM TaxID=2608689 RepID=UPI0018C412DF|nr:TauD/TfdA family dioxygenase [Bacillus sp. SRB3LM]MBG0969478.1 TauD/TfdA family dioxygenase [Bacillus sp. SRB3LM]MBG0971975.1 TauD/TfdA family dioxygenase [Bacillus sp. SRB3LM]MBG0971997.1 TauD/TfdA family dioxygenase [Bacillus sp. SRB3LM]